MAEPATIIGRLRKKLAKTQKQRDFFRQRCEHYTKVMQMHPSREHEYKSVQDRRAERERVKGLEQRIQEQALLIEKLAAAGSAALPPPPPESPCWLVERRKEGRTTGYLGHANGSYEWMPTPDKATRFVRREDANGVAECIETEDVIVAEHIWG